MMCQLALTILAIALQCSSQLTMADKCHQTLGQHLGNKSCSVMLYLVAINLAHDIESNPGPNTTEDHSGDFAKGTSVPFPCGTCKKNVEDTHAALVCDSCDQWYHINCQNVSETVYDCLIGHEISWNCINCGMPNFSTALFNSLTTNTSNPFSVLDTSGLTVPSSVGSPLAASSPNKE